MAEAYVVTVPEPVVAAAPAAELEYDDRFAATADEGDFDDEAFFGRMMPEVPAQPSIDFERVRADAQRLIDSAEADGEALLQRASQRARELVDQANARVAEIEKRARTKGHDEGLAQGREAAHAELAEDIASIRQLVEAVRAQRKEVIESAEPELVNLAIAIAERVVHEHLSLSPSVVLENVRHALGRLVGREVVTLRINPADIETIREHRDAIGSSSDVEHLRIVEDQRVDRGGVIVETESGTIDAKVSTQLREARRAVQSGDTISAAPAHETIRSAS